MEDLQATVEIAVDLGRLCNVDLFQRGFYQVAIKLLEPSHPYAKAEVHIIKPEDADHFCPSRVLEGGLGAVSKCLQVLYKREECQLNHTFLFRVHCLLDSQKIMECLKRINFIIEVSLHFSNSDDLPDDLTQCMEEVSKKTLKLELDLMYGLFANTMVLFDYGYMAAVEVTIHASLVALHQPFVTMPGLTQSSKASGIEPSTLESILFRPLPGMSAGQAGDYNVRMSNAISVHAKLAKILLTVYANMQNYYITLLKSLPVKFQDPEGSVDVTNRLSQMTSQLQRMHTLEEIVSQVNMNLASTCSLLLGLWSHVIESSCQNYRVRRQLAQKYHKQRVKRFQDGFFTTENPRNAPFDESRCGIYNWLASEIRSSRYFLDLPALPIHSGEADGTTENLPIIFEDIYTHQCRKDPLFRPKSAPSIFSRATTPLSSSQASTVERDNGFVDVSEEIGREEVATHSPNSGSVSSCGEASETMDASAPRDEGQSRRKKYSGIFRKRRGSYKIRSQRLSVSDDESTKVTLAEFLSSIDGTSPPTGSRKSSSTSSEKSAKSKPASIRKHAKVKVSRSYNDAAVHNTTKKRSDYHHRRSFDGGVAEQRIVSGPQAGNGDGLAAEETNKVLSRSYSSSALISNSMSQSSLEASDDISRPLVRGFSTNANRKAESRFRAYLRSETSEEPESGISEKTVVLPTNPLIAPITVTTSSSPHVSIKVSTSADNTLKKKSPAHHGIVKSRSYSVGIEKLQNGTDNNGQFPRPHDSYLNSLPPGASGHADASRAPLAGLDRVRYGMGLHPGGGTVTTTDLSPFDEPEPLEAWGEISSSSTSGVVTDQRYNSTDDVSALPKDNEDDSHDDTLNASDVTPVSVETKDAGNLAANERDYLSEVCDINEFLKSGMLDQCDNTEELLKSQEPPGSFFFENADCDGGLQGSTLPPDVFGHSARSQSLVVCTGSLTCCEEPCDSEFLNQLTAFGDSDKTLRNAILEPAPTVNGKNTTLGNANSSNATTVNDRISSATLKKVNSKMSTRTKLNQLVGDINLCDVEAALMTSIDILNAIPPVRQLRERNHSLEKKKLLNRLQFPGYLYSELPPSITLSPYLTERLSVSKAFSNGGEDHHMVVCVHGLDGNSNDLRLVKTYLQLGVPPTTNLSFLMSRANQEDTYGDIDTLTERLVNEIIEYIDINFASGRQPSRISFIGHSLGCLLIRATIAHERMAHLRPRFHTFLSFSGPHLGTIFNNSALVSTGLWLIQKWKKSACLLQLACKDHADMRKTYIYKLSKRKGLEYFKNVLLIASAADRYVPYHSARIEMCKQAFRDKTLGPPYQEMLSNIMKPVLNKSKLNLVRYHVVHALPNTNANTVIGRAAHIAVLDSEVFLEKFFLVSGLRYFV